MNGLLLAALLSLPPCPPPVRPADVFRFPPDPVVEETLRRGCEYRQALRLRLVVEPRNRRLEAALESSCHAAECWGALWAVRPAPVAWDSEPFPWSVMSLTRLRDLIGPEAYAAGVLPDIAPVWAFTDVDD